MVAARTLPPMNSELPNGGIEYVVSDTGVGVDPASREIIFSKFYQPGELSKHSTSKTRFLGSGAGLGLALSKGIMEAHGGRIWVESTGYDEVNFPGSQFHVLLPLESATNGNAPMGNEFKITNRAGKKLGYFTFPGNSHPSKTTTIPKISRLNLMVAQNAAISG